MPKTGADHLNSLRDGRTIYLDGQRIADVVEHPAYRNAIRSTAHLYDFQAAPENLERPCGRGLMLMRHYMTAVHYNGRGNTVTMSKLRNGTK